MPMYEYTCKQCEERFEVLVRSSSSPAPICPSCGGEVARRAAKESVAIVTVFAGAPPAAMPLMPYARWHLIE